MRTELKAKCRQFSEIAAETNKAMIEMQKASMTSELECEKHRKMAQIAQLEKAQLKKEAQVLFNTAAYFC